jgi:drug/metabolite transporter (DMT)-like permease
MSTASRSNRARTWLRKVEVDLVLLAVAFVWGASYLAAKTLTATSEAPAILSIRFILSTAVLGVIWLFKRDKFTRAEILYGSIIGFSTGTVLLVETNGIKITSATNAGLIISLAIIFTPIIESVWRKLWLPKTFFVATVGSVVGVALLVSGNGFRSPNIGDLLMLAAAVLRAVATTAQGRLTVGKTLSSLNLTIMHTAAVAVMMLIIDAPSAVRAAAGFSSLQWLAMIFLVLLCTVFGFFALMWGIRRTSASRASLLLSTEPIWAVVVAIAIGGETLALLSAIGAIVIVTSTYFGQGIEAKFRAKLEA